jgi:glycosyltransferase involved in cell wall biosynthesis
MPRVAHVISSPEGVGGAERVVASLVQGAFDRGWEPAVFNPFTRDPVNQALAEICAPAPYAGKQCSSPGELPALWRWLGSMLSAFRPEIVHVHLFHASVAVASVRLPPGSRALLTHHHGDHLVRLDRHGAATLDRWAGKRYDSVVAISEAVRRFLIDVYGYPPRKVERIRNGWEGKPLERTGSDPPTVICVGNFREQKGHLDLIEAFAQVRDRIPEARLVLVGEGDLRPGIEESVRALKLSESVELRGEVQDVWPEFARADVFALASHYEPLGIAVIEAMAAGLPVVATAVGGIPELVAPGETGRLVEPGNNADLADSLTELLRSAELRSRFGREAEQRAQELRMEDTVNQYLRLYDGVRGSSSTIEIRESDFRADSVGTPHVPGEGSSSRHTPGT